MRFCDPTRLRPILGRFISQTHLRHTPPPPPPPPFANTSLCSPKTSLLILPSLLHRHRYSTDDDSDSKSESDSKKAPENKETPPRGRFIPVDDEELMKNVERARKIRAAELEEDRRRTTVFEMYGRLAYTFFVSTLACVLILRYPSLRATFVESFPLFHVLFFAGILIFNPYRHPIRWIGRFRGLFNEFFVFFSRNFFAVAFASLADISGGIQIPLLLTSIFSSLGMFLFEDQTLTFWKHFLCAFANIVIVSGIINAWQPQGLTIDNESKAAAFFLSGICILIASRVMKK